MVSLIIPCYNEESYLGNLLNSVANQSVVPDEIIICDNNSTDNTIKVAKSFQNILPIKIITQKQKGIRPTVEKAWTSSSGDIILRADADCFLPKDWVKKYLDHFAYDPELMACGGTFRALDGNIFIRMLTSPSSKINNIILSSTKGFVFLYGANFGIRRQALTKINGYLSQELEIQDDLLISKKISQANLKVKTFSDVWNYTSLRRFDSFQTTLVYFLSGFIPRLYIEKTT